MVEAARDGDQRALDALVADSLPLVYNIVGRALNGHNDVDDVVQETLLRVVRGLPSLRDAGAFRSWLVAIAVRQVRDREQDRSATQKRRADLDTAEEMPDPASDFAALTILRLGLTDQRREVAEATRWLDQGDRGLLALWWLEETGELRRTDLAGALGLSGRHAAVRVQRMKEQLQIARTVVRALNSSGCSELRALTWNWDGVPTSLWRKRFARHVRECGVCGPTGRGMLPVDRLLSGLPLLPIPAGFVVQHLHAISPAAAEAAGRAASHLPLPRGGAPRGSHAVQRPRGVLSTLTHAKVAGTAVAAAAVATTGVVVAVNLPPSKPTASAGVAPQAASTPLPASSPSRPAKPKPSPSPTKKKASPKPTVTKKAPPPVAVSSSAKKGVGVWTFNGVNTALAKSGASWYYTWSTTHNGVTTPKTAKFVPMIWGADSVNSTALAQAKAAGPYLLGFNEPDMGSQSNMSADKALSLWPKLMSAGKVLGSPAVAYGGDTPGGWLDKFMKGAKAKGYRVDFITLHWYGGDFNSTRATSQLKGYLQAVYNRYHKPIWLTEYALIDFSNGTRFPSDAQQAAFVKSSTKMLAGLPYVQRYAWFGIGAKDNEPSSGLFKSGGVPTEAGRAFQAAR
ncbi:sigma-70 family RNA polymerase sigma factor [Planotetraspora thailandica]|nr:sigma-70 family RNA polymerase sigma factor [Planotetraspora thailandica]